MKRYSLIANNYPSALDNSIITANNWLQSKQIDDEAEGLWRIHDNIYDLTDFINIHPGGPNWLKVTKGTDISEAFEVHHINFTKLEPYLKKYRIREASKPRNVRLTFKNDGFYKTLKTRVGKELQHINIKKYELKSKIIIDFLLCVTFLMAAISVRFQSNLLAALNGILLTWTAISAHNFFHRKDNIRMYYFNLSFMNYRDWRISHALSHHLYPNSLLDIEILMFEPFLRYLPNPQIKGFIFRYASWIYGPIFWSLIYIFEYVKRIVVTIITHEKHLGFDDLIPFSVPLVMYLFGNNELTTVLKLWMITTLSASFVFGLIGLNAGHHHPEIVHDGDALNEDLDWGIYTLDTIIDREDLRGNHFLVLTHFGDHALHHLFPTLDHGILPKLYPVLFETIAEFEIELRVFPWFPLIVGQFQQLARIEPMKQSSFIRSHLKKHI